MVEELGKKVSRKAMSYAFDFNKKLNYADEKGRPMFKDALYRAAIWAEPNSNVIYLKFMTSNVHGNWGLYIAEYNIDEGEMYYSAPMLKGFLANKGQDTFKFAFEVFVFNILNLFKSINLNHIMLDLSVERYTEAYLKPSPLEEGSMDLFIKFFDERSKDDFGFSEATSLVGSDLALF